VKRYWWLGLIALAGCADATAPECPVQVTQTVAGDPAYRVDSLTVGTGMCVTTWRMP
jgi:hypothetical protein